VNPILKAAAEIDCFCTERGLPFCIIGGLAVLRWGQPRLTRDVDLTIVAGFGAEQSVIDPLLEQFDMRRREGVRAALPGPSAARHEHRSDRHRARRPTV